MHAIVVAVTFFERTRGGGRGLHLHVADRMHRGDSYRYISLIIIPLSEFSIEGSDADHCEYEHEE